jgi:serine/threonine protein kinase
LREKSRCPYFSLELVDGGSLDKMLHGQPQPPRKAAELVEKLARAMHCAHLRGIIHRDLKPGNILLQIAEDGPNLPEAPSKSLAAASDLCEPAIGSSGQSAVLNLPSAIPKVTDFGLAKRLEDNSQTQTGALLGTPSYMAPEQAAGNPKEVGLPTPEPRIDYQDLSSYLELAAKERLSGFVELPWRFLNPEVNANANGLADMNAGFKYAFLYGNNGVATFQLRAYIPTGDASRGLGNHHVSLEPAFLFFKPLTERLGLEGEFRYWVPIDGTDFAGDLIRYGVGVHYDIWRNCGLTLSPVAEFVGWIVLSGKESAVTPSGVVLVEDAAGDTIVNAKLGLRLHVGDVGDFYAGYGRSLTGDRWYENTWRVEFRVFF